MGLGVSLKRWIVRGAVFTVALNISLYMGWLDPMGNPVTNAITGFAIWTIEELVARIAIRG
jgi:hypothetical protein